MTLVMNSDSGDLLAGLNDAQRAAAEHIDGPVLIHAGAGSGKTRVLTHRIAHLLRNGGVQPWKILAVTFTNKAAAEMKDRILQLSGASGREIWIGTFHSISARILRIEADKIGYGRNFAIYDRDDQTRLVKAAMRDLHISEQQHSPEQIISRISRAKNDFVSALQLKSRARDDQDEIAALVYGHYQKFLRQNNAMDFDDLLLNPIRLFEKDSSVLEHYQSKFEHVLVDEYQDTNKTQYIFLNKLTQRHRNLCVVGDDDQSIYRWRGADIRNILNIEKDYPGCKIFRLEQNYRSTKHILNVANCVVQNNLSRREKVLWTENAPGEKVTVAELQDDRAEALFVVSRIKSELQQKGRNFTDFVLLYRTNAQSRVLEDRLRRAGIPYGIVGGVRFYERKEVKDVLAYLRLICNPRDSVSLRRIINFPLRGIGDGSVQKMEAFANAIDISLFEAVKRIEEVIDISPRIRKHIAEFGGLIQKYMSLKNEFSAGELARAVVDEIGILKAFKEINSEESFARADNVRELLSAIASFSQNRPEANLDAFLEEVALISDVDTWDDRSNAITLMTLHSAKGLEFPVVFITGLEEGLFPLTRTFLSTEDLEEERRLFYVGATRAEEKLYMTWAAMRMRYGESFQNLPSRFLGEIDGNLIERVDMCQSLKKGSRFTRERLTGQEPFTDAMDAMPAYEDYSQEPSKLYLGCEVRHATFGIGKIIRKDGHGEMMKLTVRFYEAGEKRLLVKYANLEVLG